MKYGGMMGNVWGKYGGIISVLGGGSVASFMVLSLMSKDPLDRGD
jgi:hypothetical protein